MVGREMRPTAGGEAVTETIILIQVLKSISQEPKNDSCSTVLHHHRHACIYTGFMFKKLYSCAMCY